MKNGYQYENRPRNIFRFALAVWRILQDAENTHEAAIVELPGQELAEGDNRGRVRSAQVQGVVVEAHAREHEGRGDGQEVQLAFGDEFVSREGHATIIFYGERDGFILRDGGKANPVLVNGASVRGDQQLRFGDIICIGETALLFSSNEPTGT